MSEFSASHLSPIIVSSPIPDATDHSPLAYFTTVWPSPSTAVVAAVGDIDASNSDALASYTITQLRTCERLVLDLTNVKYFGADGYSALRQIDFAIDDLGWVVVPSREVSRLLRVADREGLVITASTVPDAEQTLGDLTAARRAAGSAP